MCAQLHSDAGIAPAPAASSSDEMQFDPMNVGHGAANTVATGQIPGAGAGTAASAIGVPWYVLAGMVIAGGAAIWFFGGGFPRKS